MVYGRYNYSIHGVYKPTNITGGHHPVGIAVDWHRLLIEYIYEGSDSQEIKPLLI